ncbi:MULTISPECIES: hypothetical protein [Streptomyces]|uniref:Uncharacterized protein n=2 Tax=Streptomyces TaxID=1883 RepID=A0A1S6J1E1_9ACTN|nr:hypothetical protein [Streptomyces pactum]AQS65567.1 hypothetical protein B1H29_00075 [Streptomyces pactum]AQS71684.1 hypothetical protein B1H29_36975 [Streptomyces pactum]
MALWDHGLGISPDRYPVEELLALVVVMNSIDDQVIADRMQSLRPPHQITSSSIQQLAGYLLLEYGDT